MRSFWLFDDLFSGTRGEGACLPRTLVFHGERGWLELLLSISRDTFSEDKEVLDENRRTLPSRGAAAEEPEDAEAEAEAAGVHDDDEHHGGDKHLFLPGNGAGAPPRRNVNVSE